jgi:hypothetical protein
MRTSGGGNRDFLMMGVPVGILVVYGLLSGGGFRSVLFTIERALWRGVEWVVALVS